MIELLKTFVTAPRFAGDEEKTRRAELLHILSWAAAVVALLYVVASIIAGADVVPRSVLVLLIIPVLVGVQWLMRRGRVTLSSWVFCLALFAVLFAYAVITPESREAAIDGLIVVVMVAGLLLGFRVAWGFAALSVYANMWLWYAGVGGRLPGPPIESGFFSFVIIHLVLVLAALFVLYLAIKSLEGALDRVNTESTKRRRSDSLLRRMSQVVEQSPSIVAITDTGGRLVYVNPAFTRTTGYEVDEVLGKNPRILKSGIHPQAFYRQLWATVRAGHEWRGEFANRRKDGSQYWERASISPLRDARGEITHFIKVAEDVTGQKRAEQELRDLEHRYHTTVDAVRDPIHVVDVNLRLMLYNKAFLTWLGALGFPDAPIGEYLFDVLPFLPDKVREEYRAAIETGETVYTEETTPIAERMFVTETQKIPIVESGAVVRVVTVIHDITERVRAEQALQQSEGKFRRVVEQSTDAIILTDEQGNVIEWNRGAEQLTGLRAGDVLQRPIWEIQVSLGVEAEDITQRLAQRAAAVRLALETGKAPWLFQMVDTDIRRTDGAQRTTQSIVFPISTEHGFQLASIMRDVTERRRTESALIESLIRYRVLFENAKDALFIMDHDRFVECNPRTLAMYGYASKDQILGKTPFDLSPPVQPDGQDSRESALKHIHLALQGHPQRFDWRHLRGDGTALDVNVSLNRIAISGQEFLQAIVHDITDRVRAEELVRRRLEIERTVAFISSSFVNNADLGAAMAAALAELGRFSGAKRVHVFYFDATMTEVHNAYAWYAEGEQQLDAGEHLDLGIFAWVIEQLRRDVLVQIADVARLPDAAVTLKRHLAAVGVTSLLAVPIVVQNRLEGFLELNNVAQPDSWSEEDHAWLRVVAEIFGNVLARSRAEEALYVRDWAIASAINGVALADLGGNLTYVNSAFLVMWGFQDRRNVLGRPLTEFWEHQEVAGAILEALSDYGSWIGEAVGKRKDGTLFNVQVSAGLILTDQGKPLGLMASFIDITERKRMDTLLRSSLREKEMLLREIHHRVNNNMQVIHSLLNIQASRIEDAQVRDMFRESQNRVRSMALVHEKLYRAPSLAQINMAEYVTSLATHLFQSYQVGPGAVHLQVDVPSDIAFGLDIAIPCGLILNELISNALKHAFPSRRLSQLDAIYIGVRSVEHRFEVVIRDNGSGLPAELDFWDGDSLGFQLVQIWVEQLSAEIEVERDSGTMFRLTFADLSQQELDYG